MTQTNNPARPGAVPREDCEVKAAGTLVYGVPHGGRRHYDFTMRLPTMGDNVDALEAHPDASGVRIDLAMFAACMERLGDIPADDIGYELLAEIDPADMDVIYAELAEAKKSGCYRAATARLPKDHPHPGTVRHPRATRPLPNAGPGQRLPASPG